MFQIIVIVVAGLSRIGGGEGVKTPLQLCQMNGGEVVYRLPMLLNCSGGDYQNWRVKLEKANVREYESEAWGLEIVKRKCVTEENFWGTKTSEKSLTHILLGQEMAEKVAKSNGCITEEGAIVSENGKNQYDCRWEWMKKVDKTTVQCKRYQGKMVARHGGPYRTDLTSFHGCEYSEGFCKSSSGMMVGWKVVEMVEAEYESVGFFNAVKVNHHLLIEELGIAINLTGSGPVWTDREFKITKMAPEEEIDEPTETKDPLEALRDELNGRIEYVVEMMRSPKAKADYLCDVWNKIWQAERVIAGLDPTAYIRLKIGNQAVIAQKAGNFIVAFPCIKIDHWRWDEVTDKCYNGLPVIYRVNGSTQEHRGYVVKHNVIDRTAIEVSCHKKRAELVEVEGLVEWHSAYKEAVMINTSRVVDLSDDFSKGVGVVDFLNVSWVYEADELVDSNIDRLAIEEAYYRAENKEGRGSSEDVNSLWEFLGVWNDSVGAFINAVITWAERGVVIAIVIVLWRGRCGGINVCKRMCGRRRHRGRRGHNASIKLVGRGLPLRGEYVLSDTGDRRESV